jgi:putative CocE/NonD family hydrolase
MKRWKGLWAAAILLFVFSRTHGWAQAIHTPYDPDLLAQVLSEDTKRLDFDRREEMIPMRDGVSLFTLILVPRAESKMPILLTRTPYGATRRVPPDRGPRLASALPPGDDIFAGSDYIRVFQDVRGKYQSGGAYVMNLPLRGPLNATDVDHSTDTYDTIEWLIKNVPQSNGRVGMIGTSYDGFLVLMGLVNPHPALKAAVAINPMVDTWIGDDWFHGGAFRQMMVDFLHEHQQSNGFTGTESEEGQDDYDFYLRAGSAGEVGRLRGLEKVGLWNNILQHPSYDAFWQGQALDKILAHQPLAVPTMYIHGLWDQEDIYGAIAAYKAMEAKDSGNDMNYLVIGPWSHGKSNVDGSSLGPLKFDGNTSLYFRQSILLPFLNERLKEKAPKADTPPVLAYETGTNVWRRYDAWPQSCEFGCQRTMTPLYLKPGFQLGFDAAPAGSSSYAEYVSDPAHPVLYSGRPILPLYSRASRWGVWLLQDQRSLSHRRTDVLSYETAVLTQPVELTGQPVANLFASTSGTDSDFVVKLIDVFPEADPLQPELSGYQLILSADILRGRYRGDRSNPSAITPGKIEQYRWNLPAASHVFLAGHRIMVQIQSSWFPLYDRNPQTYVENIFWARPGDYQKATQRIYHTGAQSSYIELPLIK